MVGLSVVELARAWELRGGSMVSGCARDESLSFRDVESF